MFRGLWAAGEATLREMHAALRAMAGPALPGGPANLLHWARRLQLPARPSLRDRRPAVAAANGARGVEAARVRVEAADVPEVSDDGPARPPAPPPLPEPDADTGKIYAAFGEVRAWAGFFGIRYDGGNMDQVNKLRAARGLPPLVQVEDRAA